MIAQQASQQKAAYHQRLANATTASAQKDFSLSCLVVGKHRLCLQDQVSFRSLSFVTLYKRSCRQTFQTKFPQSVSWGREWGGWKDKGWACMVFENWGKLVHFCGAGMFGENCHFRPRSWKVWEFLDNG